MGRKKLPQNQLLGAERAALPGSPEGTGDNSHLPGNFAGATFTTRAAGFWPGHYEHLQGQRISLLSHIPGSIILKNFSWVVHRPDPKLEPNHEILLPLCKGLTFLARGLDDGDKYALVSRIH